MSNPATQTDQDVRALVTSAKAGDYAAFERLVELNEGVISFVFATRESSMQDDVEGHGNSIPLRLSCSSREPGLFPLLLARCDDQYIGPLEDKENPCAGFEHRHRHCRGQKQ